MRELKGDQPKAFEEVREFVDHGSGMHLLHGFAGTGKTFLSGEIVEYCRQKGKKVLITAPTHKAVKVLKDKTGNNGNYSTIHAGLGMKEYIDDHGVTSFKHDSMLGYPAEEYDIIIVDEGSMVVDLIFDELVELTKRGKKVLFIGDPYQIPPVNHIYAKPFLKKVQAEFGIGVSTLKEIIRQAEGNPIIQNAYDIRTRIEEPVSILNRQAVENDLGVLRHIKSTDQSYFENVILPMYKSEHYQKSIDYVKIIGWRNDTVNLYNNMVRDHIFGSGVPKIVAGDRLVADVPVVEDRVIHISTNEEMDVLSASVEVEELGEGVSLKYYKTKVNVIGRDSVWSQYMIRIIHEDSEQLYDKLVQLQVALAKSYPEGSYQRKSAWMDYKAFTEHWHKVKYSYALTGHKAQGSTYNTAYVLEWDIRANFDVFERNRILYTACTRPSNNLYIEY